MKLMFASDIHGSALWCERLMEAFDREQPDRLVLLGDNLYHGPRNDLPEDYNPKRTAAMLNERAAQIIGVRGNCDAEIDQVMLSFPMMADYALAAGEGRTAFVTHGHLWSPEKLPALTAGSLFVYGHFHVPVFSVRDGIILINPGSVAIPKDGSVHSFCIWEGGKLLYKELQSGSTFREENLA